MTTISRAIIKSYDVATHTAAVQIAGSLAVWLDAVPVSDAVSPDDVVAGRECGVIFFTDDNPQDAAVITVHNALPIAFHRVRDTDGDTRIDVERTANENKIAMYTAGTLRWLLQNSSPHATLTGDMRVDGYVGVNVAPIAGTFVIGQDTAANNDGKAGVLINFGASSGVGVGQLYGVLGRALANDGSLTQSVGALSFYAGIVGTGWNSATLPICTAIEVRLSAAGSSGATIADFTGVDLQTPIVSASTLVVTSYTGMIVRGVNSSKIAKAIGYKMTSFANAATVVAPLELDGPARTTNKDGSYHRMNVQFGSATRAFGGGDGVIGIANATTNPSSNPANGVVLYVSAASGDTKFRGNGGQICTVPTGGAANVTGSRGGNAALANLLTALAALGWIVDGTT